jgi:hypothetical protein
MDQSSLRVLPGKPFLSSHMFASKATCEHNGAACCTKAKQNKNIQMTKGGFVKQLSAT